MTGGEWYVADHWLKCGEADDIDHGAEFYGTEERSEANAHAILTLRNLLPAFLDEYEALEHRADTLEKSLYAMKSANLNTFQNETCYPASEVMRVIRVYREAIKREEV